MVLVMKDPPAAGVTLNLHPIYKFGIRYIVFILQIYGWDDYTTFLLETLFPVM